MQKLAIAVVALSFSTAYAQAPAAHPAASGHAAKPAAAPSGAAAAPSGAAAKPEMAPPKPGPETEALKPFAKSSTMTGTVPANAMGNPAELPTKARSTCKWVAGNLWVACDIEETVGTGKQAMKWSGHWVFGWDFAAKGYRGVMVSSMGDHMGMQGTLADKKMTWETMHEMKGLPPGAPTKVRITEDATDAKAIKFTEEGWIGGKWVEMETGVEKTH